MTLVPQRGEVWWMKSHPAVPNDPHLPRPAVIVSIDKRNEMWDSVIAVPLSHGLQNVNRKIHKYIPQGAGGCPKDCFARCDLVSTIDKAYLDLAKGPLGTLGDKFMWEIVRGIRAAVGDNPDL